MNYWGVKIIWKKRPKNEVLFKTDFLVRSISGCVNDSSTVAWRHGESLKDCTL